MGNETKHGKIEPAVDLVEINHHLHSQEDMDIFDRQKMGQNGISETKNMKTHAKEDQHRYRGSRVMKIVRSAKCQIYISQFLSSWGDRMWTFSGGLFLLQVTPGSMRLAAVYGAALALTVITLGAPVGRWIDRTQRLKAAQVSLCIQNLMVCVCAAILVLMTTQQQLFDIWDGWGRVVGQGFVIMTACMAQIGTVGSRLTIERDWILVLCGQDNSDLAGMNSILRSLDLSSEIFAPMIVGAIMTSLGMSAGGIFIAAWNLTSLVAEYGLLHYIYYANEDLQKPKNVEQDLRRERGLNEQITETKMDGIATLIYRVKEAWESWLSYMRHPIRDAGLGQSFLYVNVVSFNNYSRAYIFEAGISETILGVLTAAASLFGIFGALAYPKLRSKIGIANTGLFGYITLILCMALCVGSVFAPGSPFDANAIIASGNTQAGNPENTFVNDSFAIYTTYNTTDLVNSSSILAGLNVSKTNAQNGHLESLGLNSNTQYITENQNVFGGYQYTSVIFLLIGMITSRFGLWISDLSVTQTLQEQVEEGQRGSINGVQWSLNQSFDLLRAILLIILPTMDTFGFLIIFSFLFTLIGVTLYGVYTRRERTRSEAQDDLQIYHF